MVNPPLIEPARCLVRLYTRLLQRNSSSSCPTSQDPTSFGIQFLVEKCGIPLKLNPSLSRKLQFDQKSSSGVKSIITFFKSHGFSEADLAKLIQKQPLIIRCRLSSNLNPKIQYFLESGFKGSILRQIVLGNPGIFFRGLKSRIKPTHAFLKTVLGSDDGARVAIRRAPHMLTSNLDKTLTTNIECLAKQGMPRSVIVKFIILRPMTMVLSNHRLMEWVENVKSHGVLPNSPAFLPALHARVGRKDSTWKRKMEIFKSWGWSDEDVVSTFARQPRCFSLSDEKLSMALDFFINQMGIRREVIIANPLMLVYSMKGRTRPRFCVVKVLEAEKLLGKWSLNSLLVISEEMFIKRFIMNYPNRSPHLLEIYYRSKNSGEMSHD